MKLRQARAHRSPYADLAFFAGWAPADVERLQRFAEVVDYEPGELVIAYGRLPVEFVVIVRGRAVVLEHGRPVGVLTEGETIGEVAMLAGRPSPIAVVADSSLRGLLLGPRQFNGLLCEVPSMGRRLSMLLAGRLREPAVGHTATA